MQLNKIHNYQSFGFNIHITTHFYPLIISTKSRLFVSSKILCVLSYSVVFENLLFFLNFCGSYTVNGGWLYTYAKLSIILNFPLTFLILHLDSPKCELFNGNSSVMCWCTPAAGPSKYSYRACIDFTESGSILNAKLRYTAETRSLSIGTGEGRWSILSTGNIHIYPLLDRCVLWMIGEWHKRTGPMDMCKEKADIRDGQGGEKKI